MKTVQNSSKRICRWILTWEDNRGWISFTEEAFLWVIDSNFDQWQFKVKQDINWLLMDYCDVFISCLDSHSDGTHSLQRIHWWSSDVMLNFSKSALMKKNASTYWSKFSANFHFWQNYSFKPLQKNTKIHILAWKLWIFMKIKQQIYILCLILCRVIPCQLNQMFWFWLYFFWRKKTWWKPKY